MGHGAKLTSSHHGPILRLEEAAALRIQELHFIGAQTCAGLEILDSQNIQITHCQFDSCREFGVYIENSRHVITQRTELDLASKTVVIDSSQIAV